MNFMDVKDCTIYIVENCYLSLFYLNMGYYDVMKLVRN